jgi:hypothetical protein
MSEKHKIKYTKTIVFDFGTKFRMKPSEITGKGDTLNSGTDSTDYQTKVKK